MQVNPANQPPRLMTEVEKLQVYVHHMREMLYNHSQLSDEDFDFIPLLESIIAANEIVHNMDYANDFYKIGGFDLLPGLLDFPECEVRAATAELIADMLQNNLYCQSKFLETNLAGQLLKLIKDDEDKTVCVKALYALSCLCRSNFEAVKCLQKLDGLPVLVQAVQSPVEKLRTKAAFLLSHLVTVEPTIMDNLYDGGFVQKLADLIKEDRSCCQEHLLSTLLAFVQHHEPSRILISKLHSLEIVLKENLRSFEGKEEYQESKDYTLKILKLCFS